MMIAVTTADTATDQPAGTWLLTISPFRWHLEKSAELVFCLLPVAISKKCKISRPRAPDGGAS
jgi:hypothetical protein